MARLIEGQAVVGARTAEGFDAVRSATPLEFTTLLGWGTMALQQAYSVEIEGGDVNSTDIGIVDPADGQFTSLRVFQSSASPDFSLARSVDADTEWKFGMNAGGTLGLSMRTPITGGSYVDLFEFAPDGTITLTEGNLTVTAGDIDVTVGDLTLDQGHIAVTQGNIATTIGFIYSADYMRAVNHSSVGGSIGNPYSGFTSGVNKTDSWAYLWAKTGGTSSINYQGGFSFQFLRETTIGGGTTVDATIDTSGNFSLANNLTIGGDLIHLGTELGVFNTTPTTQQVVSYPPTIVTTETAGGSYTSNEQDMLNNLKTDVTNIRDNFNDLMIALKGYGIIG